MNNDIEAMKRLVSYVYCNDSDFLCGDCPCGVTGPCLDPEISLEEAMALMRNKYSI